MTAPHGYEIEDLRVFREVESRGSLTAAAAALHYTQSGISRRIAALERATGGPLFVRQARGVRLTPAGVVLHRLEDIPPGFTHALLVRDGRVLAAGPIDSALTDAALSTCFAMPLRVDRIGERWSTRAS